mmetsp:Transcript_39209/g.63344  ORF Transcript_39209/g.63344 Transcript_39209/m.63344 type:complete len:207 (+) Transcript_39209:157-777(+)
MATTTPPPTTTKGKSDQRTQKGKDMVMHSTGTGSRPVLLPSLQPSLQPPLQRGSLTLLLLWSDPDQVIDAQDGDGRLRGELQRLQLGDHGLQHPGGHRVAHGAVGQVQAVPLVVLLLRIGAILRGVVANPECCEQVDGIQRGVDGKGLGDGQERLSELRDGPLLVGVEGPGEVLQVEAQRGLHGAATRNHGIGLHGARNRAERVMD